MGTAMNLDRLGDLVSTLGSPVFGGEFFRLFSDTLGIDECTVFSFPSPERPRQLVVEAGTDVTADRARRLASDYVAGGFRGDPNVSRWPDRFGTVVYRAEPQAIPNLEYRRHYYDNIDVAHELVMLGRAGSTIYYSSFYRASSNIGFDEHDIAQLKSVASFVLKALHRHNELTHLIDGRSKGSADEMSNPLSAEEEREQTLRYMQDLLVADQHSLSPREAEVCAAIVLGYSTLAISLKLGISPHTVATHRKRAYAKLGISSHNELFIRYFTTVKAFDGRLSH